MNKKIAAAALLAVAAYIVSTRRASYTEDGQTIEDDSSTLDMLANPIDTITSLLDMQTENPISEVIQSGAGWLIARRPDGSVVKLQGVRAWRNNNPGNIEWGSYARSMGALGTDGRFAVWPSYTAGRAAKSALLFGGANYRNLSLSAAIARWAPPSENNTAWYASTVLASVGGSDRTMSTYTQPERDAILDAMQRVEGYKIGTTTQLDSGNYA